VRARIGQNFDVSIGRATCKACSVKWNSVTNSSFALGPMKTTEKPWSSWPVAGPSGCKLTSSQQSGIKYANPNVSPYLCVLALSEIKVYIFVLHFFSYVDILDEQQTVYHIFITENCLGIDNFRFYCCEETFDAAGIAGQTSGRTAEETPPPTIPQRLSYFPRVCMCTPLSVLGKGSVATKRLGKHAPVATNIHATIDELLDASFSMLSVLYQRNVCV
jgi:hypothetical protein